VLRRLSEDRTCSEGASPPGCPGTVPPFGVTLRAARVSARLADDAVVSRRAATRRLTDLCRRRGPPVYGRTRSALRARSPVRTRPKPRTLRAPAPSLSPPSTWPGRLAHAPRQRCLAPSVRPCATCFEGRRSHDRELLPRRPSRGTSDVARRSTSFCSHGNRGSRVHLQRPPPPAAPAPRRPEGRRTCRRAPTMAVPAPRRSPRGRSWLWARHALPGFRLPASRRTGCARALRTACRGLRSLPTEVGSPRRAPGSRGVVLASTVGSPPRSRPTDNPASG
jgi:hypothetical protein